MESFVGLIEALDLESRRITVSHAFDGHTHELPYDRLILALGTRTNYYNLPGVEDSCFTIKTLSDAIGILQALYRYCQGLARVEIIQESGGSFAAPFVYFRVTVLVRPDELRSPWITVGVESDRGLLSEFDPAKSVSVVSSDKSSLHRASGSLRVALSVYPLHSSRSWHMRAKSIRLAHRFLEVMNRLAQRATDIAQVCLDQGTTIIASGLNICVGAGMLGDRAELKPE